MNLNKISNKAASWALIIVGIGHTVTDLTSPKTDLQLEFMTKMKAFPIEVMGTQNNIFSFHQGFSLMMGLLLLGYGLLNLLIIRNLKHLTLPVNILILNIIISAVSLILSVKYFFIVPIVLIGIAFIGFSISLITKLRK